MSNGSIDVHQYVDDETRVWNIRLDVSDQEALGGTRGVNIPAQTAGRLITASNKKGPVVPRYIILQSTTEPARKLSKVVCNVGEDLWTGASNAVTLNGELFSVTSRHGEVRNRVPSVDTGIIEEAT